MNRNESVTNHPAFVQALTHYRIAPRPGLCRLPVSGGPEVKEEDELNIRQFIRHEATPWVAQGVCDMIVACARWEEAFLALAQEEDPESCSISYSEASETGNLNPQDTRDNLQARGGNPFDRTGSSSQQ